MTTVLSQQNFTNAIPQLTLPVAPQLMDATLLTGASMRLWHDRLRFMASTYETSPDGTTYTAPGGTAGQGTFTGRSDQGTAINDANRYARWTFNSGGLAFAMITRLLIKFGYVTPAPSVNITYESSADGLAWTTRLSTTITGAAANQWVVPATDHGSHTWLRFTFQVVGGPTGGATCCNVNGIEAQTARWGDQGSGFEAEEPYTWNSLRQIGVYGTVYPATNNSTDLGTSGLSWKDLYLAGLATMTNATVTGTATLATLNATALATLRGRARIGFNAATVQTPLTTSAAEFELSSQSMVTIGESAAADANPALTMYRTSAGLRVGTAFRQLWAASVGPFKWQLGSTSAAYGAETYTDLMSLATTGSLSGLMDNSYLAWDATAARIGFSKKAGQPGKIGYAGTTFAITEYVGQSTITPTNVQTDRLTIAAGGNAAFSNQVTAPSFIASGGATSDFRRFIETRTIPNLGVDSTVSLGTATLKLGSGTIRIGLTVSVSGVSVTKVYELACSYNQTAGAYRVVPYVSGSTPYANLDVQLEAAQTNNDITFRIRNVNGTTLSPLAVAAIDFSSETITWVASTTTASAVAAVTTYWPSVMQATELRTNKIDSNPPGAADIVLGTSVNANGKTMYGFPTPVNPDWAATKDYVDTQYAALPIGTILMWPTATPPTGWLVCDGSTFSATLYPDLNTLLGGNTLPDYRDRSPVGVSATKANGSTGGSATATLATAHLPGHTHTISHTHTTTGEYADNTATGGTGIRLADLDFGTPGSGINYTVTQGAASPSTSGSTGSGTALPVQNPYLASNFIIKALPGGVQAVTAATPSLTVQEENSNVGTGVATLDFRGPNLTASSGGAGETLITAGANSMVKVVASASQTLTAMATWYALNLATVEINLGSDITITNAYTLTINTAGLYRLTGQVAFGSTAASGRRAATVGNGTGTPSVGGGPAGAGYPRMDTTTAVGQLDMNFSGVQQLAVGATIQLSAYQNVVANLGTSFTGSEVSWMLVERIG